MMLSNFKALLQREAGEIFCPFDKLKEAGRTNLVSGVHFHLAVL